MKCAMYKHHPTYFVCMCVRYFFCMCSERYARTAGMPRAGRPYRPSCTPAWPVCYTNILSYRSGSGTLKMHFNISAGRYTKQIFYHVGQGPVQIGSRKSSSEPCYTPKVVLFKKSLRNAEFISALNCHKVCLKSIDESIIRCKKQSLLFCIALQSALLVAFRILIFFAGKSRKILTKTLFSTLR